MLPLTPHLFPKGISVMMMSTELVLTGSRHTSHWTESMGRPGALGEGVGGGGKSLSFVNGTAQSQWHSQTEKKNPLLYRDVAATLAPLLLQRTTQRWNHAAPPPTTSSRVSFEILMGEFFLTTIHHLKAMQASKVAEHCVGIQHVEERVTMVDSCERSCLCDEKTRRREE